MIPTKDLEFGVSDPEVLNRARIIFVALLHGLEVPLLDGEKCRLAGDTVCMIRQCEPDTGPPEEVAIGLDCDVRWIIQAAKKMTDAEAFVLSSSVVLMEIRRSRSSQTSTRAKP